MKRESDTYTVRQVTADKQLVDTLLANNKGNRSLSKARVDQLVRDIRAGDWRPNGSTITIDADGNLLDGQHRLEAIKAAGYPRFITLILVQLKVRGEAVEEVYVTMNSGRTNSAAQIFTHRGVGNAVCKTAICRQLVLLGKEMNTSFVPSRAELIKAYGLASPAIDKAASMKDGPAIRLQAPTLAAFVAVSIGQKDTTKLWEFARDIGLGANLKPGTAGHRLFVYSNAAGGHHASTQTQKDMFIRTLNAIYQHLDSPDTPMPTIRTTPSKTKYLWNRVIEEAEARGFSFAKLAKIKHQG